MKRAWMMAAGMVLPMAAEAQVSPAPGNFSPAQRAEIVAIVRDALKTDPSILRDAVTALQQDSQQKQDVASSAAIAAHRAEIFSTASDVAAGNPAARVEIVEFFDVRCPYCRRMRPDIDAFLAQDRDVKIVMKDLPILGPASVLGAKALIAAKAQGGYLKLQAALMGNGVTVDEPTVRRLAVAAGLDWDRLIVAMDDPAVQAEIDRNLALARALGIQGTPAFVMGDQLVSGAMTVAELHQAVTALRKG